MAERKPKEIKEPKTSRTAARPASDPEKREQQLVSLAVALAEKQLREGTAAPSIINHYLKIASNRETLEREILAKQSKLIDAKASSITEGKENEKMAKAAIEAMKNYNSGS